MDELFRELDALERADNLAWHAYVKAFSAHAAERSEMNQKASETTWLAQRHSSMAVERMRRRIHGTAE